MNINVLKLSFLLAIFATLLMMAATTGMAQSTTRTTIKDQPVEVVVTQCEAPFEPITFTGSQNSVYEVINNHDGTPMKFRSTATWERVVGTTPSGATYKGKSKTKEEADLDGLPSFQNLTLSERFKSRTKGAPDLVHTIKLRIRIDADGNITQDKVDERSECKP